MKELFLTLMLAATLALAALADKGQVVGVSDGDTLTLLTIENRQVKVRLAEIDAPESGQPYGQQAKQALSELVFGKTVRVEEPARDRYGRTVGRVYVQDLDVNAELVRQGLAWVYRGYAKDAWLFDLEHEAREAKRGLWSLPESQRLPPWEWRRTEVERRRRARMPESCGEKRYCKQMASCAEAKFYLEHCGLKYLDGNRSGRPCQTLCRE